MLTAPLGAEELVSSPLVCVEVGDGKEGALEQGEGALGQGWPVQNVTTTSYLWTRV